MHSFLVALQFLTRLPSPIRREITLDQLGASIGWFPLVGALIGVLLLALDSVARLALHPTVVDALLVAALITITGALHLDGIIDTADGFAAGPDPAAQLAAMRQAQAGSTGAVAGCLVILATYAAIAALPSDVRGMGLLIAPVTARTGILMGYGIYPYARPEPGFSRALKDGATPLRTVRGLATSAAVVAGVGALGGLGALALTLLWTHLVARIAVKRVGGLTGDILGAICETGQVVALLATPVLQPQ